jgi:hypothetical protein
VSNGRVRIETSNIRTGFFVIDSDAATAHFVKPGQRVFMDAMQSSLLSQLFVRVDANDPCTQWTRMAENAGTGAAWHCTSVGQAAIGERKTMEYMGGSSRQRTRYAWIDEQLHFPVKILAEDGATISLEKLREGPQPEDLFEIPTGYTKFDPRRLIERLKQSDVWVEPR